MTADSNIKRPTLGMRWAAKLEGYAAENEDKIVRFPGST